MSAVIASSETGKFPPIRRGALTTLQVNLTYACNQACHHCHVEAGPARTEAMSAELVEMLLAVLAGGGCQRLDLTGGAPELHPQFRDLVTRARAMNVEVLDRCNLTILEEPGHEDLAAFLAAQGVSIVASLPCYLEDNVDQQRGRGVFGRSIRALRKLNELGYGVDGTGLRLDLVYNPQGASLPPPQAGLEAAYKAQLAERYEVRFNRLLALTNMPIKRFRHQLQREGQLDNYAELLASSFSYANLERVMCRELLSVDWQGALYDCDFNQQLGMAAGGNARHLRDLLHRSDLEGEAIAVASHCFGCTAGQGSSCGGAL